MSIKYSDNNLFKNVKGQLFVNKKLSIVSPVYNEEEMVLPFLEKLTVVLSKTNLEQEIIIVNDGSLDKTLAVLLSAKQQYPSLRILNLSRNFGKEAALTAGLDYATGDAIIPIDCDLQDPPELILEMIQQWEQGFDVVLAKRSDRNSDSFLKRFSARWFYKIHNKIADTIIPENVGDYRLMTKKVVNALKQLPENQRFMKGIFAWAGFKTTTVEYSREIRAQGNSKFNSLQLWNLALDGITSFSTAPLRIWVYLGMFFSFFAFLYGSFVLVKTIILGVDVPGYASLLTSVLFFGGVQLLGIGVLGEYLGRMFKEVKRRPIYLIEKEY